jgi:hypothetical protein
MSRILKWSLVCLLCCIGLVHSAEGASSAVPKADSKAKATAAKAKPAKKARKTWNWRKRLPQLGCVYPAGGQRGTRVEVIVAGQQLRNVTGVSISGEGVRALSILPLKNVNRKFFQRVRYDLACAISNKYNLPAPKKPKPGKKKAKEEQEEIPDHVLLKDFDRMSHRYLEIAARNVFSFQDRLQEAPAIREEMVITLEIAPDAVAGQRELRLWGLKCGLSNPLRFYIGDLPEVTEERLFGPTKKMKTPAELPAILNGQVMPGEVDSFVFKAKRGQQLVFSVLARRILPYLGDAVPGWFQPVVSLHGGDGQELAFADDFGCSPDPALVFEVPTDGEYELRIRDSIYRGRKDFVYRIRAGELPFVTSVFPLGAPAGQSTGLSLRGYNLSEKELMVNMPETQSGLYRLPEVGDPSFNPVFLAMGTLPEIRAAEGARTADQTQAVTLGTIVNGRIERPGDADVFKLSGRAGEQVVFEVDARRLGSPLDAVLVLRDHAGKIMFTVDDLARPNMGLNTHQADPYRMFTLPADGDYYLTLRDVQNHGGDDFGYRLRISRPRPDFRVYSGVSGLNLRRWQTISEQVRVVRLDGFDGSVTIRESGEMPIFKILSGPIEKGQDEAKLSFQLLDRRPGETTPPGPVEFVGTSDIDGRKITRRLVPCENMMQAFIYYHWVPQSSLMAFPVRK